MRQELDEYLVKRYPDIFQDRNGTPDQTNMCWGFQCGDGWFNLLDALCSSVQGHISSLKKQNDFNQQYLDKIVRGESVPDWVQSSYDNKTLTISPVPTFVATQIKEKFGTLRFYHNGGDDYIDGLISLAENLSGCTCEECGKPGKRTSGGWIRTLCAEHTKSKPDADPLKEGSQIYALGFGEFVLLEIIKVNSQEDIIGKLVPEEQWDQEAEEIKDEIPKHYSAKYVNNDIHPYWNAVQIDI